MLTGRREAPLQETAGLISVAGGLPALVAPADLTDAAAVERLFAACAAEHGRLDVSRPPSSRSPPVDPRAGCVGSLAPATAQTDRQAGRLTE